MYRCVYRGGGAYMDRKLYFLQRTGIENGRILETFINREKNCDLYIFINDQSSDNESEFFLNENSLFC